ncbi:MAG: hypothetical protein V1820_05945 [archaeon]
MELVKLFRNIKENFFFSAVFLATLVGGILAMIYKPLLPEVEILKGTFWLFGLSLQATVIILWIGGYLLYRWNLGKRKNSTQLVWGVSFLLYSVVFIGMALQALGFGFADAKLPWIFFVYRQFMILWLAGIYWGLAGIVFAKENRLARILPTAAILLIGYGIFANGLFIVKDVEYTMYSFLYLLFVPVCFILSRIFWKYAQLASATFARYLSIGFAGIGITYLAWAPWHKTTFYFVWFFLYVLSLIPLLVGFLGAGQKST